MNQPLRAVEYLTTGFPEEMGATFAKRLLADGNIEIPDLQVDLHGLPSRLLISAFFNGFLQAVHELAPEELDNARNIQWLPRFEFQRRTIQTWMDTFTPC